jgi:Ni,Fe-hydrogenase III component G
MEALIKDLEKHFHTKRIKDSENVVYMNDCADSFMEIIDFLKNGGLILISLFAVEDFEKTGFSLMYIFEKKPSAKLLAFNLSLKDKQAVSVARIFPVACYFEREIRDGFGIEFAGAFDKRRLFLHEAYPDDFIRS